MKPMRMGAVVIGACGLLLAAAGTSAAQTAADHGPGWWPRDRDGVTNSYNFSNTINSFRSGNTFNSGNMANGNQWIAGGGRQNN